MSLLGARSRGGAGLLLALLLYAVLMAWLLGLPCRLPGGGGRLCAGGTAPAAGGLLAGGPPEEAPALVELVTTVLGWFAANVSALLGGRPDRAAVENLPLLLLLLAWVVTVVAVHRATPGRADALVMGLAPAVLIAGFSTWDLWAVLFMVLALLFHARGSGAAAGVCLGLGASVALFPAAVLLAVLFLAARHRRLREFTPVLLGAVLTWALVNGPSVLTSWARWQAGVGALAGRPVADSSFWGLWARLDQALTGTAPAGTGAHVPAALVLGLLAVLVLTLLSRQEPGAAQVALLVLAVVVLFGTDGSTVQVLWLVPLVVLARQRPWEFVLWQLVELLHWAVLALPPGTWPAPPWTGPGAQDLLGVLRVLFLVHFVVVVAADVLRGRRAPVGAAPG